MASVINHQQINSWFVKAANTHLLMYTAEFNTSFYDQISLIKFWKSRTCLFHQTNLWKWANQNLNPHMSIKNYENKTANERT